MKYLVLRNCCFTNEGKFYERGQIIELPKLEMYNPKNFKAIDDEPDVAVVTETGIADGKYYCGKCKSNHIETDKKGSIGKRHLKHKE